MIKNTTKPLKELTKLAKEKGINQNILLPAIVNFFLEYPDCFLFLNNKIYLQNIACLQDRILDLNNK